MLLIGNAGTYKHVRLSRWNPLVDQVVVVVPLQHESNVADSKFVVAVENQRPAEIFVQYIAGWNAEIHDANGRCTYCENLHQNTFSWLD